MPASTTDRRNLLAQRFSSTVLRESALAPGRYRPVPAASDRTFWDGVPQKTRKRLLSAAEDYRDRDWPQLLATNWLDYARTGNRLRYEDRYFGQRDRLAACVLAACLTDDPAWLDQVVDGVWLLLEQASWCLPCHDGFASGIDGPATALPDPSRPFLDLFAAETGALLAWTHIVLGDRLRAVSPLLPRRLVAEVTTRVLTPHRDYGYWVWFGRLRPVNNWNPWINGNVLACSLLLESDRDQLLGTADRVVEGLDYFLDGYPDDGGCDEGQSYWWRAGASLAENLEFLRAASDGALDAFDLPLVREMARYPYRVHVAGDWYVNVGDGGAQLDRGNAGAHLLWQLGNRIGDPALAAHGRSLRGAGPVVDAEVPLGRALGRSLLALADPTWADAPDAAPPLIGTSWLPETGLLTARQQPGSTAGLFVSVKGGGNDASHNHNDVGTFTVAVDGVPALVDAGVGDYRRETFSAERYSIWTMRSDYHSVPSVDGVEQQAGHEFRARGMQAKYDDGRVQVSLDLATAYPTGMARWDRSVDFDRVAGRLTVIDDWELDHDPSAVLLRLISWGEPTTAGGALRIPAGARTLVVDYDEALLHADVEPVACTDRRLAKVWGDRLWRTSLAVRTPERTGRVELVLHAE